MARGWGIGGGLQRGFGLANVEAAEAAFNQSAARSDDFFVQAVVVTAQHNDAAMGDDYRVGERRVVHHARRDAGKALGLRPQRPDFGAQQAQAHLHKTMVEMGEHDIISAGSEGSVEDHRPDFLGVGMSKSVSALGPAIGKSW